MAGKIKKMIDGIIQQRAKGNPAVVSSTKIKIHHERDLSG